MKVDRNRSRKLLLKHIPAIALGFVFAMVFPSSIGAQSLASRSRGEPIAGTAITNTISFTNAVGSTNLIERSGKTSPEFINWDGEKYRVISFAQLASFIITSGSEVAAASGDSTVNNTVQEQVPDVVKALNEKSVALTGFMLPVHTENGLTTDFLLLRNQSACCYGVMPKINEWVVVRTMGKGVKTIMDTPITVLGTFHVGAINENGKLSGIYKLECDRLVSPKE
jgi:hypothetical protein